MKLKKGIKFLKYDGENLKELRKFTGMEVEENTDLENWPLAILSHGGKVSVAIYKDDYVAKHGEQLMDIPEDIIKFVMQ